MKMKNMSRKMDFFIFLIEHYSAYKKTSSDKVLKQLEDLDLINFVYDMYEIYHQEAIENAYNDIDALILEKENESK